MAKCNQLTVLPFKTLDCVIVGFAYVLVAAVVKMVKY